MCTAMEARYHLCVLQWRPDIIYVYCNGGQVSFMCTAMEARYHLCVLQWRLGIIYAY